MKFAICATVKNENLYIREWVEYHLSLGFDKIILYDNDGPDDDFLDPMIQQYIDDGKVDVIKNNYNHNKFIQGNQVDSYNDCLKNNTNNYDWILFIDADEFLYINKYKNVKYLFETGIYDNFDAVVVNMIVYGKDVFYYENKPLQERFPERYPPIKFWNIEMNWLVHPFIRPSSDMCFMENNPHVPKGEKICNESGLLLGPVYESYITSTSPSDNMMYTRHYLMKSFVEFIDRLREKTIDEIYFKVEQYKSVNKWTEKHEKYLNDFIKRYK